MQRLLVPILGHVRNQDAIVDYLSSLPWHDQIEVRILFVKKEIDVIGSDGGRVSITHEDVEIPNEGKELIDRLRSAGIEVSGTVGTGEGIEPVLEAIEADEIDGLVIGDKRRSPVGKAIFGSDTLDILQQADIPVTLLVAD